MAMDLLLLGTRSRAKPPARSVVRILGPGPVAAHRGHVYQSCRFAIATGEILPLTNEPHTRQLAPVRRAHGLAQKVPKTHRYHVTEAGRAIIIAVLTSARTSLRQLNQLLEAA